MDAQRHVETRPDIASPPAPHRRATTRRWCRTGPATPLQPSPAVSRACRAYPAIVLPAVEEVLGVEYDHLMPSLFRKETLSSIMLQVLLQRASCSAFWTWRSQDLPKMATHRCSGLHQRLEVPLSSEAQTPALRVLPNADQFGHESNRLGAASKKALSLGLDPGQPPSMKSMPN